MLVFDCGVSAMVHQKLWQLIRAVAYGHVEGGLASGILFVRVMLGLQQQLAQISELILRGDM